MPTLEITTRIGCSNACVYCPQDKLISAYAKRSNIFIMSFETFKQCIDKIPPKVDIEFSGMAEAWLNPECTKMVLYAHKKGHKINVYTTLIGMKQEDFDLLKQIPFQRFWLHLPSANNEEKILVDEKYLSLLKNVYDFLEATKDSINVSYHFRGKQVHPAVKNILGKSIERRNLTTRADNIVIKEVSAPARKKGVLACERSLYSNVLLPNGEVILCCMDYGLKHVLGNLLKDDYVSLFKGDEFLKVKKGLRDESLDILCRYCDMFAYEVGILSKINKRLRKHFSAND